MLETVVEQLLLHCLDPYVDGISKDKLHLGVFNGSVELLDLRVKPEALALLGFEGFRVRSGSIRVIKAAVPWSKIYHAKVRITVEAVHLEVEQIADISTPERSQADIIEEVREAKRKAIDLRVRELRDLLEQQREHFEDPQAGQKRGVGVKALRKVLNNIQATLSDVRVSFINNHRGLACGFELPDLRILSTDQTFRERADTEEVVVSGTSMYKLLKLRGLGVRMSSAGSSSLSGAEYVLTPISADLQLAQVPSDQILRLRLEIATKEIAELTMRRSQVKHLRSVQASSVAEAARLHALLVPPEEEAAIYQDPAAAKVEYGQLYERQLLHEWRLAAAGDRPLSPDEAKRSQLLEDALSIRLLARQRWSVRSKVEALNVEVTRRQREAEEKARMEEQNNAGFMQRVAGSWWGADAGARPEATNGEKANGSTWLSTEERQQLLQDLNDNSKVETVDLPQRLKFEFVLGKVSLDLIDDRYTDPVRMQLLRVDLQDVIWEVHVDMLPDHLGRDSAEWRVECSLSTFRALHAAKNVCRLCSPDLPRKESDVPEAIDRDRGVSWLDRVVSTKVVLENKLEPDMNLLKCCFEFAPLEVHLVTGALEKLLELFVRNAADDVDINGAGNDAGGERGMRFEDVVDISKELLEVHGDRAMEVVERVYEQIPDRMHLEVRIASPIVHVPVIGLGNATFSLGHLELITPQPCAYSNIDVAVNLTHTSLRAVSTRGERFNIIEPVPVHLRVEYRGAEQENSVDIQVTVQEVTLSLAPQALQILVATPAAVSSIMAETEAVFPSDEADASSSAAAVPASSGDAAALATTSLTQRASDFVREVLGEDSAAKAANLLQVAEEKAKQFRFNLNLQLDSVEVIFADSIVPVMRLHLEMLPPGLVLYQQTVPPALSLDINTGTLEIEILNTRNGAWEPLMERFCLGLQLVRTPEGEDEFVTHVIVSGHEPLLINLSPTAMKRACWILPLFLSSLSPKTPQPGAASGDAAALGSGSANAMKYRVVNLCDHPLDLAFKCRNNDGFSMQIQPTGSLWEPLDDWVLPHFATALTAKVPKGEASELLLLERAGAVLIPDSGAVAEMIAPSPSHRLLLLASPLRLHNQTDLTLLIRFHDAVQREVLLVHVPDTSACDAALLGYDLPDYAVHSQFKNGAGTDVTATAEPEDSVLILGPNAYCAVPAVAVVGGRGIAVNNAHTWLSIKPAVLDADFCAAAKAGASADPQMVCCRGNGGTRDGLRDVHLILESSTYLAHPSAPMSLTTIAVRPALALLNALPVGNLRVSYAGRARSTSYSAELQPSPANWHEAHVPRFHCLNVYSFPDALEEGISICARLEEDAPWSSVVEFRREEFEETSDAVRTLQLCQSEGGAAACIVVEPRQRAELRISSPYWLADRSGMTRPLAIELRRKGRQLPSADGITLLPADCFEESCELLLRSACSSFATQLVRMPPSWCTLPWQTPCGSFVFCVQTDDVASCDVLGARCQVMTLRPRLVLTNASDLEIELWDARSRNLRLTAGQSLEWHWQVPPGDEDSPSTAMLFRPLSQPSYKWSGAVVCSDTTAGSTPFLLSRAPSEDGARGEDPPLQSDAGRDHEGSSGQVTVWSVEVAPIRGALAVSFRKGSDFVAANRALRAQLSMVIRPLSGGSEGGTISIPVPQGREVPYGWSRPFQGIGGLSRAVDVLVRGTTMRTGEEPIEAKLRITDVRRTTRRVLHQFGVAVAVTRVGTQTLLTLEDHEAWQDMSPKNRAQAENGVGSTWLSRVEVKLSSLGISLVQELPQARELLYCHLDLVRLEWRQNDDDVQQLTLVITEAQVDCQLPGRVEARTMDLQRRESLSLVQRERPTVIFANCASGDRAFLSLFLQRSATSSRDLVLPCVDIALDALDVTLDDGWLDPLVGFLKQASPEDPTGGGLPFAHVMQTAGRPIAEGYSPPLLPPVIQVDGLQISAIQLTVWCALRLASVRFLPAYVRTAIRVLSLSGKLTLDGATLSLEPRTLTAHRGSLSDFSDSMARLYAVNLLNNAAAVLGKSSVLNVTRVPLKFGSSAVSYVTESVGVAAGEAASLLSRLTFDSEYVTRQRQIHGEKEIRGIGDGVVEAGKSLAQGVEGLFDVVRKPVQGAHNGFGGFLAGVGRGVAGTFVKPISKVGQAIGDLGSGIAATVAPKRRRARLRQRQPRLLFSELGEIRPWCPLDAELLRQLDRRLTNGVECVVPLTQSADANAKRLVLMLFARRLVVAEVKMPSQPAFAIQTAALPRRSNSGSAVNGNGQKSSELAQKDGWVDALDDSVHKVLLQVQKPIKSLVYGVQDIERQLAGSNSAVDAEVAAEPQLSRRARELSFGDLAAVHSGEDGGMLQLEDTHGNMMEIPLFAAPVGDLARRALLSGFRSAVANAGGIADWTSFRAALRKERRRVERRGLRAAPWQAPTIRELRANAAASSSGGVVAASAGSSPGTGNSSSSSNHQMGSASSPGPGGSSSSMIGSPFSPKNSGVGQRILEVFEVERWSPAAGKWANPFLPGDRGLSWRWVDATGSRHPHLDPSFTQQEIVSKKQPPCKLNALFHLISDWAVDVHDGTDEDGWRYGIAWNASTWDSKPGLIDALRRRRWTRTYS